MNISKILIVSTCMTLAPIRADAQASANANVRTEQLSSEQQVVLERALSTTFRNSPPMDNDVNSPGNSQIGMPAFSWQKGTPTVEALPFWVLAMAGAGRYNPASAVTAANGNPVDLEKTSVGGLGFTGEITFNSFIKANPQLWNIPAGNIPGLTQSNPDINPKSTLGSLANGPMGTQLMPKSILDLPTSSFPGILQTPYSKYAGIDTVKIGKIPGIPDISYGKLFSINVRAIPPTMQVVNMDKLLTGQKDLDINKGNNISSGSPKEPHAACNGTCTFVEFRSIAGGGASNPINGTLGRIGGEQPLKGGKGLAGDIATAAGLRQPAGYRVPYIGINGCGSTWSAESPDSKTGSIKQQINLGICWHDLIFGDQALPDFIPVPLGLTATEKGATMVFPMEISPVLVTRLPQSRSATSQASSDSSAIPQVNAINTNSTNNASSLSRAELFGTAIKSDIKVFSPTLGIFSSDV
jgi:hypothetical protein